MSKKFQGSSVAELEEKRNRLTKWLLELFKEVASYETQSLRYNDVTSQYDMEQWEALQERIKEAKNDIDEMVEDIQEITNIIWRETYLDILL